MKILAGLYKGRKLVAPKSCHTRPTGSKTREAVFDILTHAHWRCDLESCRVIDIFAGSGALGLEALSRKAAFCLFIDHAPEAITVLRRNIYALDLYDKTRIYRRNALKIGPRPKGMKAFDLVFLDPPYYQSFVPYILDWLIQKNWLNENAVCVIETAHDEKLNHDEIKYPTENTPDTSKKLQWLDNRIYGAAHIWFLQYKNKF